MNAATASVGVDEFFDGYLSALLWTGTTAHVDDPMPLDEAGYTVDDFSADAIEAVRNECTDFFEANRLLLERCQGVGGYGGDRGAQWSVWELAGHDFLLTRQGHGAGFWDRGLGDLGEQLSTAARAYGGTFVWEAGDGSLEVS